MINDEEDNAIEQDETENDEDEESQDQDMAEDENEDIAGNSSSDPLWGFKSHPPRTKCIGSFRTCKYIKFFLVKFFFIIFFIHYANTDWLK